MLVRRGSPEYCHLVHLYVPQNRPGMVENVDYSARVACNNGSYHISYTDDMARVTCPKCYLAYEEAQLQARYQTNLLPPQKRSGINWTEIQPEAWVDSNPVHSNRGLGREFLKPIFESLE